MSGFDVAKAKENLKRRREQRMREVHYLLAQALEGLHAQDEAEDLTKFSVDLVELERIHTIHADDIRQRGRLVYERG